MKNKLIFYISCVKLTVKEDYKHTRKYNIFIKYLIIILRNEDQISVRHVQFVITYSSFSSKKFSVNAMQFYVIKHSQSNFFRILLKNSADGVGHLKEMSDITEFKIEIIIRIMKARQRVFVAVHGRTIALPLITLIQLNNYFFRLN